jgi:hypothetical protein
MIATTAATTATVVATASNSMTTYAATIGITLEQRSFNLILKN